jgi:hypothetical protein
VRSVLVAVMQVRGVGVIVVLAEQQGREEDRQRALEVEQEGAGGAADADEAEEQEQRATTPPSATTPSIDGRSARVRGASRVVGRASR